MSSKTNGFAQGTVLRVAYSMLGLTSCVVLARAGLGFLWRKRLTASDCLVYLAFSCYATMCALYICSSPYMQRLYDVVNGVTPPYAEMEADTVKMTKMVFAAPCLPRRFAAIWWITVGICIITHIGNYVFYFRSCGTISGFWKGGCEGHAAKNAQLTSLFYSFTADTITNLMIMALPIRLIWNLQMPRSRKYAIGLLFASGVICIIFASLRVAQVAVNAAKPEADGEPLDPTWLAIWGMVECSIAVIIGCCPAFAVLVNSFQTRDTYDSQGYWKQSESGTDQLQLRTIGSMGTRERNHHLGLETTDLHWAGAHSNQEHLKTYHDGIRVLTTVTQSQVVAAHR
ncbi:hypothetical protein OPT61_g1843 [Boeremia exigua]|uniref:Uncharacterized protein n=1 Tax=Boeremia exigua TaxID=749465 RepID=A0ACC2INU8_9PLEO|nr:hypothetical protein OPT61_g1843 [Boeremia exigua]